MTVPKKTRQTPAAGSSGNPTTVRKLVVSDAATANIETLLTATADPASSAMRIVAAAERQSEVGKRAQREPVGWVAFAERLDTLTQKLRRNDLTSVEDMLFSQAIALQSLFVRLSEGALAAETIPNYDLKFRYALRAQSQCRATLETLATIKNPPVLFARQANVSNGPQQVNNTISGHSAEPRAREIGSEPNELSGEATHGQLSQNGEAPTLALTAHPALAPLGAIHGATDTRRQDAVVSKRLEGRRSGHASPTSNDLKTAKAKSRGRGGVK